MIFFFKENLFLVYSAFILQGIFLKNESKMKEKRVYSQNFGSKKHIKKQKNKKFNTNGQIKTVLVTEITTK